MCRARSPGLVEAYQVIYACSTKQEYVIIREGASIRSCGNYGRERKSDNRVGVRVDGATLLAAPRRRAPEERAYRFRLRDTQRAIIGSDCILEPHVSRKGSTCRFSITLNSRQVRPTDRAIANAQLRLGLIGLPCSLGSRPASSPYGTLRRGSFANFVAARTEILRVRYWCSGRHGRRLTQHISAAPHGLDVVTAAGCLGNFFAERANQNINDFRLRLVYSSVKVAEKHLLAQDRSFPQAEYLKDAVFLRGQVHGPIID